MILISNRWSIQLLLIFLVSCNAESSNPDNKSSEFYVSRANQKENFLASLKQLIEPSETDPQKWVKVRTPIYRKHLRKKSKKRVLIIDSGMYLTSITLFKDRVIGQYRTDNSEIIKDRYQLSIPELYYKFSQLQSKNMEYYHDDETQKILTLLFNKISSFEWAKTAHGDSIFNYVATNTEKLDLMVLRLNDWECYPKDERELKNFKNMMEKRTVALFNFFQTHQIDYVNFSGGWSVPDFKRTYVEGVHSKCGPIPSDDILKRINMMWKKFYDEAFSSGNTILFQASPHLGPSSADMDLDLEGYLSDCSKQRNRLRVQSAPSPDKEENFRLFRLDGSHNNKLLKCSDLFVNTPESLLTSVPNRLKLSPFGLTLYPMGWPSSYTTPMALVAWINRNQETESEDAMLDALGRGKYLKIDIRTE